MQLSKVHPDVFQIVRVKDLKYKREGGFSKVFQNLLRVLFTTLKIVTIIILIISYLPNTKIRFKYDLMHQIKLHC